MKKSGKASPQSSASYVVLPCVWDAGVVCLGLLAEISYPKFLENDID